MPTEHTFQSLKMQNIVKQFPGVLAADHIDFDLKSGEIHALLGENGAGKSTLMKMLYGLYRPDEGRILLNGEEIENRSPADAIERGIGMIHQHFMLVPSLTVTENVALGLRSAGKVQIDLKRISRDLNALSETYKLHVNPNMPIWQLSVGEQQRVEILRALYKGASLLILDEPTAVLTPQEVDDLFEILRQMAAEGRGLIFITHKLREVLALTSRVTVLRDGKKVGTVDTQNATKSSLAEMMVGRPVMFQYEHVQHEKGPVQLCLTDVSAYNDRELLGLQNVSLEVRAGEIVGLAGVSGNGQKELAEVIAGIRVVTTGSIKLSEQDITNKSPYLIKRLGLSYIPEERMIDGVIKDFSVAENFILRDYETSKYTLRGIFMDFRRIQKACQKAIVDYAIKTPSTNTPTKSLSGGNIQKLVLARELSSEPKTIIASQPTRGVDIGAMEYIHRRLLSERENGKAILLISEDLDEIQLLSDRIIVIYEGQIVGEVKRGEVLPEELGKMMAGETI